MYIIMREKLCVHVGTGNIIIIIYMYLKPTINCVHLI